MNTTTNTLTFEGKEGIFVRMLKASADRKVLLWIDEVNRGNVAKIFGEFILLGTEEPYDISIRNIEFKMIFSGIRITTSTISMLLER